MQSRDCACAMLKCRQKEKSRAGFYANQRNMHPPVSTFPRVRGFTLGFQAMASGISKIPGLSMKTVLRRHLQEAVLEATETSRLSKPVYTLVALVYQVSSPPESLHNYLLRQRVSGRCGFLYVYPHFSAWHLIRLFPPLSDSYAMKCDSRVSAPRQKGSTRFGAYSGRTGVSTLTLSWVNSLRKGTSSWTGFFLCLGLRPPGAYRTECNKQGTPRTWSRVQGPHPRSYHCHKVAWGP